MADRSLTLVFLGKDVSAGTAAEALAVKLKALQRTMDDGSKSSDNLDRKLDNVARSSGRARTAMGPLVTTVIALGAALVPLGAVAVGALAGLAPAAGVAVVAFLGLRDAWKNGTLQASAFGKQVSAFKNELDKLKDIAAGGVLAGFTKAMADVRPMFTAINRDTALFATQLGAVASHVVPGLIAMFLQLQPLFQTFGDLLVKGSIGFQKWATSGEGLKNFVAYVQANLPMVLSTLGSLVVTVSHLVQGLAPLGSLTLQGLRLFSAAINAIPVNVLQTLLPIIGGLVLGFKALSVTSLAAAGLAGFAARVRETGAIGGVASGALGLFGKAVKAAGPIGLLAAVGLGVFASVMHSHAQAAIEAKKRTNDLTQALQDNNFHVVLYSQLLQSGAIPAAKALGLAQNTVLDAVTNTKHGLDVAKTSIAENSAKYAELSTYLSSTAAQQDKLTNPDKYYAAAKAADALRTNLETLSHGIQQSQKDYDNAKRAVAEYATAQGNAALGQAILSGKAKEAAAALGLTEDAYIAGKLAADKKTASDAAATAQMKIEGDAAGLLTQRLNTLTDTILAASDANLGFKLANIQLRQALHDTHGDLSQVTQAGLQNNLAVNQGIRLAEKDGEETAKLTQKIHGKGIATILGTQRTVADLIVLRDSIKAYGGNTTAVQALIDKLTGYNAKQVPPKKIDIPTRPPLSAIDTVQSAIEALHGKTIPVTIVWSGPGGAPGPAAALQGTTGTPGGAAGGYLTGPGTKTSDSIPLWGSTGEFMMQAAAVDKYGLGFMQNLNAMKFAQGGPIILQLPSGIAGKLLALENALHPTVTRSPLTGGGGPVSGNVSALQAYAFSLFPAYGWGAGALSSLISLWNGESGWNPAAYNASSGATGIPQSLPASKMASAGADYLTNGATQIRWGLSYIASVYGSPTNAYSAWLSRSPHWYAGGGSVKGYADGGPVDRTGLALLHAGEFVVPQRLATGGSLTAAQKTQAKYINLADWKDAAGVMAHLFQGVTILSQAVVKMINDARRAVTAGASGGLVGVVANENNSLMYLATRRADIAQKLKWANNNLLDAQKRFHDEAATVSGTVRGTFNIATSSADDQAPGSTPMISTLIGTLRGDVLRATQFQNTLARLRRLGLTGDLLRQFAEAGPESANAQLLGGATKNDVAEMNRLYGRLNVIATQTGNTAAAGLFGAGVQAAKGLVAGLQSQEATLNRMMQRLAQVMVTQLRTSLHIKSPSEIAHGIGANFGQGLALGLESQQRTVGRSSASLAMAMVSPVSAASPGRGGGGATYIINVSGSVVSEKDLVRTVAQGIDDLRTRRNRPSLMDV